MEKVAVITDSIACLTPEQIADNRIEIVPLYVRYGDKMYRDGVDITPTQSYELFLKNPDVFSTSAATPTDFLEAYRKVSKTTWQIICVTLSAKLSTTYNSAVLASEYARREMPELGIEVVDSRTATAAQGMIVLGAAKSAAAGKTLPEVVAATQAMKEKVNALVLLETIKHVYRSGRVPKIAAQAGSMLNIRPMFTIKNKVNMCGAVRSFEKGVERMVDRIKIETQNKPVNLAVMHAYAPLTADNLIQRLKREFECRELWLTEFSPLMGYACGTGTVGIAYSIADLNILP